MHHGAVRHNCHVAACPGDPGFARRHGFRRKFFRLQMVVQKLVLAKNNRVIDGDCFEQHAVGVFHCGGGHDHQAGIMRVNGLEALAVIRAAAGRAATRQPNGDGARNVGSPI